MNPRRLIPYAVVFLALVATYVGLWWYQVHREVREIQAKQVFDFKTGEISAITLKRPGGEIQLVRQGKDWEITRPQKAKADAATVEEMLRQLANLEMVRDLGPGDLEVFGLDQPVLQVSFIAMGEQHRLALGEAVPASQGYYARKDDAPGVFIIATGVRDSLNQQLFALRDRNFWAFKPDQVKSLRVRNDQNQVDLEKGNDNTWRWVGRPEMRLSSPRMEQLLQELSGIQVTEFPATPPLDLQAAGLAPQARMEVTVREPPGGRKSTFGGPDPKWGLCPAGGPGPGGYGGPESSGEDSARGSQPGRPAALDRPDPGSGPGGLGPPRANLAPRGVDGRARKITGPNRAEVQQSAYRLEMEMALIDFQKLESSRPVNLPPAGAPAAPVFVVELFDQAGKPLFRLEQLGNLVKGQAETEVRATSGGTTVTAVIPQEDFTRWQEEMTRLTAPPPAER